MTEYLKNQYSFYLFIYYIDKIKNIDKSKDNYMNKNKLVFNSYKTAKTYGQQELEIPEALQTGQTASMDDDPENFADDRTLTRLTRGH